ncbi:hypothetical protein [Cyanobium sp. WKJ7-Wakatipu]|uniref:hypothetical protein n=1 Tax=Cyanobium sp. WKJ7-Wakatipu TaxID=2823726 RepID=UPI0020CCDDC8|nr:hypothetical protein [Cyanobium sp. WKJ7-Wakatipu]
MPQFAVFLSEGTGLGIEMVQAMDPAHAQEIACAQHPSESLSAVTAELLHRHQSATSCCGRGSGEGVSKYLDSEELIRGANADATLLGGDLRASLGQPNSRDIKVVAPGNIL